MNNATTVSNERKVALWIQVAAVVFTAGVAMASISFHEKRIERLELRQEAIQALVSTIREGFGRIEQKVDDIRNAIGIVRREK